MPFPIIIVLLAAALEITHSLVVRNIAGRNPAFLIELGRTGPGYYVFGLFWISPKYFKLLSSGRIKAELAGQPGMIRLVTAEQLLWYAVWATIVAAVVL
jgi:hypothetical protein